MNPHFQSSPTPSKKPGLFARLFVSGPSNPPRAPTSSKPPPPAPPPLSFMAWHATGSAGSWQIGDWIVSASRADGNFMQLIRQVCETTNRKYHTVEQAYRVANYFNGSTPEKKRSEKLSFTHHQEYFNYIGKLDFSTRKKEVEPIIKAARELLRRAETEGGPKRAKTKSPVEMKPMPVAEFREELQKITGKIA